VRGRNNDNARLREVLGWEPSIRLEQGLAVTYEWIRVQVLSNAPVSVGVFAANSESRAWAKDILDVRDYGVDCTFTMIVLRR
jgi:hypothetical protein